MQTARSGSPHLEIIAPDVGETLRCVHCGSEIVRGLRSVRYDVLTCSRNCLISWGRRNGIRDVR